MDALIDLLLDWIGENSAYQTSDLDPPAVVELGPKELTREYYYGRAHLIPEDGVDDRLNAIYIANEGPEGTIFILSPDQIDGAENFADPRDNPLWREVLLHELVHHAQHDHGAETWTCISLSESEAYQMGGAFLREMNVPDPMKDRTASDKIYKSCDG
ncbi:MAG: hypothetical protein ACU0CC_09330 [Sagittula sp.]|uniref:hypothetical protein n=1 Tax=Sagittula sp. TaxID=2038081 RepID=UPI0040593FF2